MNKNNVYFIKIYVWLPAQYVKLFISYKIYEQDSRTHNQNNAKQGLIAAAEWVSEQ